MNQFKVGDRVRAVNNVSGWFTIGQIGTVEGANYRHIFVTFDNGREAPVKADEIELIESEQCVSTLPGQTAKMYENASYKRFPTFEEFDTWFAHDWDGDSDVIYNYFAKFNIQPSRLEQLKAKHPNLTQGEQTELIDLLLNKE